MNAGSLQNVFQRRLAGVGIAMNVLFQLVVQGFAVSTNELVFAEQKYARNKKNLKIQENRQDLNHQ